MNATSVFAEVIVPRTKAQGVLGPAHARAPSRSASPPTVVGMRASHRSNRQLAVEAAAFGVGYTSVLCWASTCLVATFGGASLASPYWPVLPWLRTDTTGVIAFALAAVSLVVSKYLRLRRSRPGAIARRPVSRRAYVQAVQAVAETAAVLSTALVAYLSLNVVTHSVTLRLQLTHLWPWPSEGTVRVIALGICIASVAATRYLRSAPSSGVSDQAPVSGRVSTAAAEQARSPAEMSLVTQHLPMPAAGGAPMRSWPRLRAGPGRCGRGHRTRDRPGWSVLD